MEAVVIVFWILVALVSVSIALMILGFILAGLKKKKGDQNPSRQAEVLSEKTVENVLDLNDNFNRARYMDKDGN